MGKDDQFRYFIIYKPFGMLSQFTPDAGKPTLASLFNFPKDVYPVGRLDTDSEGLLLLTNDKKINHLLLNPEFAHNRTYVAQLEGQLTDEVVRKLVAGVNITINGKKHFARCVKASKIAEPENLPARNPPIRFRKSIPDSWITLTLQEGKNRQVRKMTAAVGFPTLRLIRTEMENLKLEHMQPSDVKELEKDFIYQKLKIS